MTLKKTVESVNHYSELVVKGIWFMHAFYTAYADATFFIEIKDTDFVCLNIFC